MSEPQVIIRVRGTQAPERFDTGSSDRSDYRTEPLNATGATEIAHIPVGMPREAWLEFLRDRHVAAKFTFARWVGRRIARRVETIRRVGRWQGENESKGHLTNTTDILDYIRQNHRIKTQIGIYRVAEPLVEYAYRYARELVERKVAHPEVRL